MRLRTSHRDIDVVCRDDGVALTFDHHDTTLVHDAFGEPQLLGQRFDQPARLFAIENVLVALDPPVAERELDKPAGYAPLVHSLVGVVADMHDETSLSDE